MDAGRRTEVQDRHNNNVEDRCYDPDPRDGRVGDNEAPVENLGADEAADRGDDHDERPVAAPDHVQYGKHDVHARDDAGREPQVQAVLFFFSNGPDHDLPFTHAARRYHGLDLGLDLRGTTTLALSTASRRPRQDEALHAASLTWNVSPGCMSAGTWHCTVWPSASTLMVSPGLTPSGTVTCTSLGTRAAILWGSAPARAFVLAPRRVRSRAVGRARCVGAGQFQIPREIESFDARLASSWSLSCGSVCLSGALKATRAPRTS